jgi:hypothetical protein
MKAKLIKYKQEMFTNYILKNEDGNTFATSKYPFATETEYLAKSKGITLQRLSHKNCDEIFGVVDVEKLASENCTAWENSAVAQGGFKLGFNKAMELNKYTEEDIMKAYDFGSNALLGVSKNNLIQSLQQPTEIEVEIEMVKTPDAMFQFHDVPYSTPKLDSSGCLILTKKI